MSCEPCIFWYLARPGQGRLLCIKFVWFVNPLWRPLSPANIGQIRVFCVWSTCIFCLQMCLALWVLVCFIGACSWPFALGAEAAAAQPAPTRSPKSRLSQERAELSLLWPYNMSLILSLCCARSDLGFYMVLVDLQSGQYAK